MKNLILITAFILAAGSASLVLAEGSSLGYTAASFSPSQTSTSCCRLHELNLRLQGQWRETKKNLASGKITSRQAEALRFSLKSILEREAAFFMENNQRDLTAGQQNQLNRMLDNISGSYS